MPTTADSNWQIDEKTKDVTKHTLNQYTLASQLKQKGQEKRLSLKMQSEGWVMNVLKKLKLNC